MTTYDNFRQLPALLTASDFATVLAIAAKVTRSRILVSGRQLLVLAMPH